LRRRGLGYETVLAGLLRIVDLTAIRVGNQEYARQNHSYGLTTLRPAHARAKGAWVELRFRGKSGIARCVRFRDPRLARLVRECKELRQKQLFQYLDEQGVPHPLHASHLNAYLRSLTAAKYSVKDYRTWTATVHVALELQRCGPAATERAAKKTVVEAVGKTAELLGNTPAVCRKNYVHPVLLEAYQDGHILPPFDERHTATRSAAARRLLDERCVLAFLTKLLGSKRSVAKVKQLGSMARATLRKAS
jgi:DNA topoisomerase-1